MEEVDVRIGVPVEGMGAMLERQQADLAREDKEAVVRAQAETGEKNAEVEAGQQEKEIEPLQMVTCICGQQELCRFALPIGARFTPEGFHEVVGISTRQRIPGNPSSSHMGEFLEGMNVELGETEFEKRLNSRVPNDKFYHPLKRTQELAARLNAEMQERGPMVCTDCVAEGHNELMYCTHAEPLVKRDDGVWIIPSGICGRHALERQRRGKRVFPYAISIAEAEKRNNQRSTIRAAIGNCARPLGNHPRQKKVFVHRPGNDHDRVRTY